MHSWAPIVAGGITAVMGWIVAQADSGGADAFNQWSSTGLIAVAFLLIVYGIAKGEIGRLRPEKREEELADIARRGQERERIHEDLMTRIVNLLEPKDTR